MLQHTIGTLKFRQLKLFRLWYDFDPKIWSWILISIVGFCYLKLTGIDEMHKSYQRVNCSVREELLCSGGWNQRI